MYNVGQQTEQLTPYLPRRTLIRPRDSGSNEGLRDFQNRKTYYDSISTSISLFKRLQCKYSVPQTRKDSPSHRRIGQPHPTALSSLCVALCRGLPQTITHSSTTEQTWARTPIAAFRASLRPMTPSIGAVTRRVILAANARSSAT